MRMVSVVGAIVLTALWIASVASAGKGDAAKGQEIYAKFCASCHGDTGKGDGPASFGLSPRPRDLTDKAYMSKLDDKHLMNVITKGGVAVGKSPLMPPLGNVLKEGDIWNIIAYIRSLSK